MHFDVKSILYCTQMGPNAAYVFRWAYTLAKHLDAKVHVLYVIEGLTPKQLEMVEDYSGHDTLSKVIEEAEAEAERRLPRRIEQFFKQHVPDEHWQTCIGDVIVARGNATDQILHHAKSTAADLVVVGAHRRTSIVESIVGTTARRLTERCSVPVLVVRIPEGHHELTITDP